jgi:hypothetical protein
MTIGATVWVIADGYIPPSSTGPEPAMTSHHSVWILSGGDADAHVDLLAPLVNGKVMGTFVRSVNP